MVNAIFDRPIFDRPKPRFLEDAISDRGALTETQAYVYRILIHSLTHTLSRAQTHMRETPSSQKCVNTYIRVALFQDEKLGALMTLTDDNVPRLLADA